MEKEEFGDLKDKVDSLTDDWMAEGRTFLVLVDNGEKMVASFGGRTTRFISLIHTLIRKDVWVAEAIRQTVRDYENEAADDPTAS